MLSIGLGAQHCIGSVAGTESERATHQLASPRPGVPNQGALAVVGSCWAWRAKPAKGSPAAAAALPPQQSRPGCERGPAPAAAPACIEQHQLSCMACFSRAVCLLEHAASAPRLWLQRSVSGLLPQRLWREDGAFLVCIPGQPWPAPCWRPGQHARLPGQPARLPGAPG